MENKNKNLIMFIGKTHSGKTTFANELYQQCPSTIVLEADPIAVFMKEKFPVLRELDDKEHNGSFGQVALKFRTFLLFVEFAMSLGRPIILSNSNMWIEGRKMVFKLCKKFNYNVIGLYFDLPESMLIERIEKSQRSTDVLKTSKDFQELIINQRSRMQIPDSAEFNEFFIVNSGIELENVKEKLTTYLQI